MFRGVKVGSALPRLDRILLATALSCAGTLGAHPAVASDIENVKSVELTVHGEIAEHCAMGQIGDMHFGDLTRPGLQAQARVQLSCNIPFDMSIKAANGGLANAQFPHGQGPYAGTLPYTIGVAIPVRKPDSALIDRSFTSLELMGGRTVSSQGGIALDGMELSVALGPSPSPAGLVGGRYGETIVITVAPS